jgi:predicted dehydrogenase
MRFIQVGVGGFGQVWANCLAGNPEAEVVGLVDINDAVLASTCEKHGYASDICYHDLKTAIRQTGADAVVSATPPARHKTDVVTALRAGLHVISEKPMADSMANCKAMLTAAREAGKLYVVSQNYRYQPNTWTMAEIIRSGKLGRIGQIKIDFFKGVDFGGGFRHSMEYPVIVDMSIHHFDLLRFITGLDALTVAGASWNPYWSNYQGDCSSTALFTLTDGVKALYNASWCAKGDYCSWDGNWQIECEQGTLILENGALKIRWIKGLYATDHEEVVEPVAPPLCGQPYVLDEFIRCVKAGGRPRTVVEDNIKSVAMVFATVKAMQSGKVVPVFQG